MSCDGYETQITVNRGFRTLKFRVEKTHKCQGHPQVPSADTEAGALERAYSGKGGVSQDLVTAHFLALLEVSEYHSIRWQSEFSVVIYHNDIVVSFKSL